MSAENLGRYYLLNHDRLNDLIRERAIKKYWLADAAGIHKTTLRRWLAGRIEKVRQENIVALAAALSISSRDIASPFSREKLAESGCVNRPLD